MTSTAERSHRIHYLLLLILWSQQQTSTQAFSNIMHARETSFISNRQTSHPHSHSYSHSHSHSRQLPVATTCLLQATNPYGRGADIWPPANDQPIRLENSFPNGVLPDAVIAMITPLTAPLNTGTSGTLGEQKLAVDPASPDNKNGKPVLLRRRNAVPRAIGRILRRAACAQEETESEQRQSGTSAKVVAAAIDKAPLLLAISLVVSGMIRPLDALLVSFLSGYFVILYMWARNFRRGGITPMLPSLPPQGHVPHLVSNPLGPDFTTTAMSASSFSIMTTYDYWIRAGALLGLLAPVAVMLRYALATHQLDCARASARPIFFMCCQAMSEALARRSLTPLPIRILIPLAYNTIRLGYLWNWAFLPAELGRIGRAVAIANLGYWMTNLFGFLIPVASVRYMRAHFFAVEAEQVIARPGMEDSSGIMF